MILQFAVYAISASESSRTW